MKKAVKWLACLGFVLGSVTASGIKVQAAAEPPAHIKKMDGIFEIKEGSTSSVDENGIVTITPNTSNSIGSIWSTNNNLLDFTKSFHLSTYLYFGENVANVGDGMALVFQAVTDSPTWFTSNASSIGYLGEQRNENSVGILNSLAIEFDLFSNITDNDGWFDQNLPTTNKGQHIAYTWPGDLTEYTSWWAWFNTQRAIAHHDPLSYLLTDDKWIRLDVDWDVESKQFQYVIDNSTVVNVPYEELYNRVLATNTQVYWGFTGSTGTYAAPQKVVFQEVPNLVEVDPKIEVYNESRTQEVLDGDEVHTNETLRFDYSVEYLGGKQNWEKVKAIFTGDPNFVLEPGSITATAFIGGQAQSYSLDDSILVDGILNFPVEGTTGPTLGLGGDLPSKMVISYKGHFTSDISGDPVTLTSQYNGENALVSAPEFTMIPVTNVAPKLAFSEDQDWQVLDTDKAKAISGSFEDLNKGSLNLEYYLDGEQIHQEKVDSSTGSGAWSLELSAEQIAALASGEHEFKVTATNLVSQSATIQSVLTKKNVPVIENFSLVNEAETIFKGGDANFQVTWRDEDSNHVQFFYQLDGGEPVELGTKENSAPGSSQNFEWSLSTNELAIGEHDVVLYAIDSEGITSQKAHLTFLVDGKVSFSAAPQDFTLETALPEKKMKVKTALSPIQIEDKRIQKSNIALRARLIDSADGTKAGFNSAAGHKLPSDAFIYQNGAHEQSVIDEVGIELLQTDSQEITQVNQAGEAGFYLELAPWLHAETYQATIEWQLIEAP